MRIWFLVLIALFGGFGRGEDLGRYYPEDEVLLVSTLDGGLTAVKPEGSVLWSLDSGGAMLSSTISEMDLTNQAQWVKLIPSLGGGLYKFDGKEIRPVPLDAETLLKSSFKFTDNTVISGGIETKTLGIHLKTGRLRYDCSVEMGCRKYGMTEDEEDDDILVLQRRIQVVRALEPRSGLEKWNFSVSQHHLSSVSGKEPALDPKGSDPYKFKAVISDGIICSVDAERENVVRWKKKFNFPIVHVWRFRGGLLSKIDLFSDNSLPSAEEEEGAPSMYVGSFENQLYIQESDSLFKETRKLAAAYFAERGEEEAPGVAWKPYLITSSPNDENNAETFPKLAESGTDLAETTALSIFYGDDLVGPGGLYFYSSCGNDTSDEESEEKIPIESIQIVFVSIWYWWKEIVFISLLTVYIFNLFFTRPYVNRLRRTFAQKLASRGRNLNVVVVERRIEVPVEVKVPVEVPAAATTRTESFKTDDSSTAEEYSRSNSTNGLGVYASRFESDYIPVQSLGRGGFGIVFECRNKIDDTHYAVKRIRLPKNEKSKKKVMREVKFLAKLDHKNIVRYYHTWLESPPIGWQEERDSTWKDDFGFPTRTEMTETEETSERPPQSYLASPKNSNISFNEITSKDSFSINFRESSDSSSSCGVVFEEEKTKDLEGSRKVSLQIEKDEVSSLSDEIFFEDGRGEKSGKDEKAFIKNNEFVEGTHKQPLLGERSEASRCPRSYLYIVMQLCQKESLKDWLLSSGSISLSGSDRLQEAVRIFHQICLGVEYVHKMGLIHRDLKPGNIFFSKADGIVKIGDFGLVTRVERDPEDSLEDNSGSLSFSHHTDRVGTELYMSPEQLANESYNRKVDIYSMGIILFELLVPFSTQMERINILRSLKRSDEGSFALVGEEYNFLVADMMSRDPEKRPEASALLAVPFLVKHAEDIAGMEHRERRRRLLTEEGSSSGELEEFLTSSPTIL